MLSLTPASMQTIHAGFLLNAEKLCSFEVRPKHSVAGFGQGSQTIQNNAVIKATSNIRFLSTQPKTFRNQWFGFTVQGSAHNNGGPRIKHSHAFFNSVRTISRFSKEKHLLRRTDIEAVGLERAAIDASCEVLDRDQLRRGFQRLYHTVDQRARPGIVAFQHKNLTGRSFKGKQGLCSDWFGLQLGAADFRLRRQFGRGLGRSGQRYACHGKYRDNTCKNSSRALHNKNSLLKFNGRNISTFINQFKA